MKPISMLAKKPLLSILLGWPLALALLGIPAKADASLAGQKLKVYQETEWNAGQVEVQRETLLEISTLAEEEESPVNFFKCQLLLAKLSHARKYGTYKDHIQQLDSVAKADPVVVGDSLLIEYLLAKFSGLMLERSVEEGFRCLVAARELSLRNPELEKEGEIKSSFAYYFLFTGEYQKSLAIKAKLHAELEADPDRDTLVWLKSMSDLAVVHSFVGDYPESNRLMHRVIALSPEGSREMATVYYRMGYNYKKLMVWDSSEHYLLRAIEAETALVPNSDFIPVIQHSLARLYSDRGDYARSTALFQFTLHRLDSLGHFGDLATAHLNILNNQLLASGDTLGEMTLKRYRIAVDSLRRREKMEREQEFRVRYETLEKEARIRELQMEKQEEEAEKRMLIVFIVLILLVLVFIGLRIRSRIRIARQELEIESLKRAALADELQQKATALNQQIQLVNERGTVIEALRDQLNSNKAVEEIIESLEQSYIKDQEWDNILMQFKTLYPGLLEQLQEQSGRITLNDQKLVVLLRLGYSTASIAEVMNISKDGVRKARQRLKDKVGMEYIEKLTA